MDGNSLVYKSFEENKALLKDGHGCWLIAIQNIFDTLNICKKDNTPVLDPENIPITQKEFVKICQTSLERRFDEQLKLDLFQDKDTHNGNKLRTFRQFKCEVRREKYLCYINNISLRKNISKLRLSAHNLPIETGRYKRPEKIPPDQRYCEECNMNMVGDEFHIVMQCPKYQHSREGFLEKINELDKDMNNMDCRQKFISIMKLDNENLIKTFATFIAKIIEIRGNF